METSRACRAAIHEPSQEELPCPDLLDTAVSTLRVRLRRSFSLRLVVDFKAVKAAVTMLQVLEHYGLADSFKRSGNSHGACLKIARGPAAKDFGRGQGGEAGASPQRAVTAEPTQATDKRPAARRVPWHKTGSRRCS